MTKKELNEVGRLIDWLNGVRKFRKVAVAYRKDFSIAVARMHKCDLRDSSFTFVVTVGKPNYEMRRKIKSVGIPAVIEKRYTTKK